MSVQLVERGRLLVDGNRFHDAVAQLRRAVAADPDDPLAWQLLSQAHSGLGEHHDGLAAAARAVSLAPEDEWGHRLASVALIGLGRSGTAVEAAAEAVRLEPSGWPTHVQLALATAELRRATGNSSLGRRSKEAAERAIALAPEEADCHFALGFALQAQRRRRRAAAAYRRALELDPDHAPAHNNLALLHMGLGRMVAATDGMLASLRSDPHSELAQGNIEVLALRTAWLGWVALSATTGVAWALTYAGVPGLRTCAGLALLALFGFVVRRWWSVIPPPLRRHGLGLLGTTWQAYVSGALFVAALVAAVGTSVLPVEQARAVAVSFAAAAITVLRGSLVVLVALGVAGWVRRRK